MKNPHYPSVYPKNVGASAERRLVITVIMVPSIDEGRHGSGGQKCVHTASGPLDNMQVFSAYLSCPDTYLLRQNCKAPASASFRRFLSLLADGTSVDSDPDGRRALSSPSVGVNLPLSSSSPESIIACRWYFLIIQLSAFFVNAL